MTGPCRPRLLDRRRKLSRGVVREHSEEASTEKRSRACACATPVKPRFSRPGPPLPQFKDLPTFIETRRALRTALESEHGPKPAAWRPVDSMNVASFRTGANGGLGKSRGHLRGCTCRRATVFLHQLRQICRAPLHARVYGAEGEYLD